MLSQAYQIARMDFMWAGIERVQSQYDFSNYDHLLNDLQSQPTPVACYWILDYGNPLYDSGLPPHSNEGIQAFVNFVVASIGHFKGHGIIWEMWNEPNGGFWKPAANSTAYSIVATAVGAAIRGHPDIQNEIYIGPATSGIDMKFLEETFQMGVLKYFDAVSVHPYRPGGPETAIPQYTTLNSLIQKYAPGKVMPILSGEWGWSTCHTPHCWAADISEELQAKFLARQWLVNTYADVPISIYYDYIDDGQNPGDGESNFGTVRFQYFNQSVPHIPKPSYRAALALQKIFSELKIIKRVASTDDGAFVLAFSPKTSGNDVAYALWKSTGPIVGNCESVVAPSDCGYNGITQQQCLDRGCCFQIPAPSGPQCYYHNTNTTGIIDFHPITTGCFSVVDISGDAVTSSICTDSVGSLTILVSDSPVYLNRK